MDECLETKNIVPIWEKCMLNVKEAAEYFNLGEKKIRNLAEDYADYGFILHNGSKLLIKRKKFEEFINETSSI